MDRYTYETRWWLELRFGRALRERLGHPYTPYQPLDGIPDGTWDPDRFLMVGRWSRLLALVDELRPASFLDVGGAEGLVSALVRAHAGIPAVSMDLSAEASRRARETFHLQTLGADAARLPFRDDSFDLVFFSEVLEHTAEPVRILMELRRVARHAVLVTTEAFARTEEERREELDERRLHAHMDRSIFCAHDFEAVFEGWGRQIFNQIDRFPYPIPQTRDEIAAALAEYQSGVDLAKPAHGIMVLAGPRLAPAPTGWSPSAVEALFALLDDPERLREPGPRLPDLGERMACPRCHEALVGEGEEVRACASCGSRFPVLEGVPELHGEEGESHARPLDEVVAAGLPPGSENVARLLALDERLRLDLDPLHVEPRLWPSSAVWETADGQRLGAGADGHLLYEGEGEDPMVIVRPLRLPLETVRGFRLRAAVQRLHPEAGGTADVPLQIFWQSLRVPVFFEARSLTCSVPGTGEPFEIEVEVPAEDALVPADALTQVRLDPAHEAVRFRVESFEVLLR